MLINEVASFTDSNQHTREEHHLDLSSNKLQNRQINNAYKFRIEERKKID